ncbi:MAG: hypothetical protein JWN62_2687 [Acidimicrobiales bacterium]|nr:hypothetical protein [Acidimicrobiales bacterium]
MRSRAALSATALVVASGFGITMAGCGNAASRGTSQFCGELQAHAAQIQTPPEDADQIPALITLYSKMGEVAPLEIQGAWEKVYGILKTANTVNPSDPASVQAAADAAYGAQQSATDVVTWAHDNCAIELAPVAFVPGGADVETTTTTAPGTSTSAAG